MSDTIAVEFLGTYVIIRTYSAGVWFGILDKKSGAEVILRDARRMWYWVAKKSISLSAVSLYGIKDNSKIAAAVPAIWLKAIEIISVSEDAIPSIKNISEAQAE